MNRWPSVHPLCRELHEAVHVGGGSEKRLRRVLVGIRFTLWCGETLRVAAATEMPIERPHLYEDGRVNNADSYATYSDIADKLSSSPPSSIWPPYTSVSSIS